MAIANRRKRNIISSSAGLKANSWKRQWIFSSCISKIDGKWFRIIRHRGGQTSGPKCMAPALAWASGQEDCTSLYPKLGSVTRGAHMLCQEWSGVVTYDVCVIQLHTGPSWRKLLCKLLQIISQDKGEAKNAELRVDLWLLIYGYRNKRFRSLSWSEVAIDKNDVLYFSPKRVVSFCSKQMCFLQWVLPYVYVSKHRALSNPCVQCFDCIDCFLKI